MKNNLEAFEDGDLTPEHLTKIATDLGVTEEEVTSMNRRMAMGGDTSLNVPMGEDGDSQWQDLLGDEGPLQDERVAEAQERDVRHSLLNEALETLNRSEEHTSELQSLMRSSYAVFCLKNKKPEHTKHRI